MNSIEEDGSMRWRQFASGVVAAWVGLSLIGSYGWAADGASRLGQSVPTRTPTSSPATPTATPPDGDVTPIPPTATAGAPGAPATAQATATRAPLGTPTPGAPVALLPVAGSFVRNDPVAPTLVGSGLLILAWLARRRTQ